ncbi:MAG: hypothetical protein F2813_05140 [Actinobacteria bacterium]|uniref:Unannotated protein n=1 Tax=freshwater metagenome TaxID=449393 RepID=A0A6J5ZRI5_9ZZZZ|nr:hypothetical protein [Actinomycetota bacterium]
MKKSIRVVLLSATALLMLPALASADYPPPTNPGVPTPRPGGAKTLKVCKKGCKYKTIQAGVNAAQSGDIVRVGTGTYKEQVTIEGHKKDAIKLIGNKVNPHKVFIDAKLKPNGVIINSADNVTVQGFSTSGYLANGFFAVHVSGYTMDNLIAMGTGVYGLYAFDSKGGTMSNSDAYYNTDAGFYIGQTPFQTTPKRSIATNLRSWGNVLGWSGTNMRYVTITKSKFFNNGTGIVPNALTSEKYPPEEDNVITDNDIMWNNWNYYKAGPFEATPSTSGIPYPIGVGILLFGGRRQSVSNNRVYGNWIAGIGLLKQISMAADSGTTKGRTSITNSEPIGATGDWTLDKPWNLEDNKIQNNVLGNGGKDLNARDLFYDGSGEGNCFKGNTRTAALNLPAFSETAFPTCVDGVKTDDTASPDSATEGVRWALGVKVSRGMIAYPTTSLGKLKPFPKCVDSAPAACGSVWNKKIKAPR